MCAPICAERVRKLDNPAWAVLQNGAVLVYATHELWADREAALLHVQVYSRALMRASTELRADRDVVRAAVQQDGRDACL